MLCAEPGTWQMVKLRVGKLWQAHQFLNLSKKRILWKQQQYNYLLSLGKTIRQDTIIFGADNFNSFSSQEEFITQWSPLLLNAHLPTIPNKHLLFRMKKSPVELFILECEWLPGLFPPLCILCIQKNWALAYCFFQQYLQEIKMNC